MTINYCDHCDCSLSDEVYKVTIEGKEPKPAKKKKEAQQVVSSPWGYSMVLYHNPEDEEDKKYKKRSVKREYCKACYEQVMSAFFVLAKDDGGKIKVNPRKQIKRQVELHD